MLYTRHFYNSNEVRAALQYSIHKNRFVEAFFWLKELDDSKDTSIQAVLFNTWFHSVGISDLNVLSAILKNDYYNAVQTLCRSTGSGGLKLYYLHGLTDHKVKKIPPFKLHHIIQTNNLELDNLTRAILIHNTLSAWHLSKNNWSDEFIKNLAEAKLNPECKELVSLLMNYTYPYKWMVRCAIICILCMTKEQLKSCFPPPKLVNPEMNDEFYTWNRYFGFKARRIYSIPKECLYGRTIRGGMKYTQTNIKELYDHNNLLKGQKVYDDIVQKYGSYEAFVDDDTIYDIFCTNYFPNDIPDEWSLEEQMKSHGIGVNQECDTPMLRRYINRWSLVSPEQTQMLEKIIKDLQKSCTSFDFESTFNSMYENKASIWSMVGIEDSLPY